MEFHGKKEKMRKIIVDAVPGGSFDNFDKGLRYRSEYGATITWMSSTGAIQVEEPRRYAGLTQDRLRNFLYPDRPPISTADRILWPRYSADSIQPMMRSNVKERNNALSKPHLNCSNWLEAALIQLSSSAIIVAD